MWKMHGDEVIQEAFLHIEYDRFEYNLQFHGSEWEPKIDRLLYFLDLVGSLAVAEDISLDDVVPVTYEIRRVFSDRGVNEYIGF